GFICIPRAHSEGGQLVPRKARTNDYLDKRCATRWLVTSAAKKSIIRRTRRAGASSCRRSKSSNSCAARSCFEHSRRGNAFAQLPHVKCSQVDFGGDFSISFASCHDDHA